MLTDQEIEKIALDMHAAQAGVRQIPPFTSRFPEFDLPAAYAVAHRVHHARVAQGARPVGRKIGFTNADMWSLYGVGAPVWGYMYDATVSRLDECDATCRLGRFTEPKIEPEIVFHFHSAPPVDAGVSEILSCIDWVAHGYEIVQSHFPDWKFQAPDTVADGGLHGALFLGKPVAMEQLGPDPVAALESFSLTLSCDGTVCAAGKGANVLGNPLAALAHLVQVLSQQPKDWRLQADEIVTTGTVTTAQPVRPGQIWQTSLSGIALPGLAIEFVQ